MNHQHHNHKCAGFFDTCAKNKTFETFEPGEEQITRELIQRMQLDPHAIIAEPGCGSGRITKVLKEFISAPGEIHAIDLSARMIDCAQKHDFMPYIKLHQAPAANMPLDDNSCDAVVCFNAFPHFTAEAAANLAEFNRVLRPGATLFVAHSISRQAIIDIHSSASSNVIHDHQLPADAEFNHLLTTAGFDTITIADEPDRYLLSAVKAS